jgi:predicted TIM-barrel fold metal-dependent hydrolase
MHLRRREFLAGSAAALCTMARGADPVGPQLIIDTHQHLWVRDRVDPPWVRNAAGILRLSYGPDEYREATRGLNVRSIYMEIDAAESDLDKEADTVAEWCAARGAATVGAIIGGRPASEGFADYISRHAKTKTVQGVRRVLHGSTTPAKACLDPKFVAGMRVLGVRGLTFDLCMRPRELDDGAELAKKCPETRFVVDHCGNVDPKAFLANSKNPSAHSPEEWKRSMDRLAELPNVVCKISGLVARAPLNWDAAILAPAVNHCLEAFGPDRVIFGSDWPVCLTRATLQQWVSALREIIASRPAADQEKLWSGNALRMYKLNVT